MKWRSFGLAYLCAGVGTVAWLTSLGLAWLMPAPPGPAWMWWTARAIVGAGLVVLWQRLVKWNAQLRILRRFDVDPGLFEPIGPDVPGPVGVKIVDPDGGEIPLTVKPHVRLPTGGTVWYAYGPPGTRLPTWGELHIQIMPPQSSILVRTAEDDDGEVRFIGPDDTGFPAS